MMFSTLADIHERLRLKGDKMEQLARLESKEDALLAYEFFFPDRPKITGARVKTLINNEIGSYYDVVKTCLESPDQPLWHLLASESSDTGSRGMSAQEVLDFPYQAAAFTEIAYRHNEIEARLLWRYLTKAKPAISKRAFFGGLARMKALPPYLVHINMTRDTLMAMFDDQQAVLSLQHWWEHPNMFPAPMRWRPWTKLHPPEEETIALIVEQDRVRQLSQHLILYAWGDVTYTRLGRKAYPRVPEMAKGAYAEFPSNGCIDWVHKDNPNAPMSERLSHIDVENYDLTEHGAWDKVMQRLQDEEVNSVRFVSPNQVFTPDGVGGYVMHPSRNKVFFRLDEKKNEKYILSALDGLDDYIPVAEVPLFDEPRVEEGECIVVEAIAPSAVSKAPITNLMGMKFRHDLGISDLTQYTDLIERGFFL